jgi:UDP-N-acetylenolpyruvoylglucosamine reductase
MLLQENIPLAPLTTLRVGGSARFFVEAASHTEVAEAVEFAQSSDLPLFVLGGGSNLVVSDSGWPGLVLKIAVRGIDRGSALQDEKTLFNVGAGESWDRFVSQAVGAQCAGVECLSGIPGSVGGTPVQNVGAYGQEVSESIDSVEVFDLRDHQVRELCGEACGFAYRCSIFNTSERGRFIILRVTYALTPRRRTASGLRRPAAPLCRARVPAQPRRGARGRPPHPRTQRHADRRRRSRLPQRGIILQKSCRVCRTARRFATARRGQAASSAELSGAGTKQEGFRSMAGRALRVLPGIRFRPRRYLQQAHSRHRQSRRSHRHRSSRLERSDSTARGRNLGCGVGTGTGVRRPLMWRGRPRHIITIASPVHAERSQ